MRITTFEITFDNRHGVFESGQQVRGKVVLDLERPLKLRSLKLFFIGKSKSWWDEKQGKNTKKYRAHETYINHYITLITSDNPDISSLEQPAGNHVYPFAIDLPATCPSSFEGRRGYVRYFCKATIDRPWKFDSHVRRTFSVNHHLDLNRFPTIMMPIRREQTKVIESCCCTEGPIDVSFQINKSGYVPGEPIIFDIDIQNRSETPITMLLVDLIQITNYVGYSDSFFSTGSPHYHPKEETFTLCHGRLDVPPNGTKQVHQTQTIPSLPPTKLEGCEIIDIQYTATCRIKAGGDDLVLEAPVIIGTIPVREQLPQVTGPQPVPYMSPNMVNISGPATEPSAPALPPEMAPPAYEDVLGPPPSYNECVFGRTEIHDDDDDEHTAGDRSWAPAYPYYDWTQHTLNMQQQAVA